MRTQGSQLHNRVHLWVGGNMTSDASPNDPVFFLNHAFVDKIWADWQLKMAKEADPDPTVHYVPAEAGPPGHNLNDKMYPWDTTPADVLDHKKLGYQYDTELTETHFLTFTGITAAGAVRIPHRNHFTD